LTEGGFYRYVRVGAPANEDFSMDVRARRLVFYRSFYRVSIVEPG
jgi:hypothetical protein